MKQDIFFDFLDLNKNHQIKEWNEILVNAARDLAEFTKHGINARFISSLALKCEEFDKGIKKPDSSIRFQHLKEEILIGMSKICQTGQVIWRNNPRKKANYIGKLRVNKHLADNSRRPLLITDGHVPTSVGARS